MYEELFGSMIAVCLGIGLAAACGFRVFVPMLVISIVAKVSQATDTQWLVLAENFQWIGSWPAIIAFSIATLLEIGAYYIPWLDNLLDTIAVPVAAVAGVVVTAACIAEMDPLLKWSLAIVAGGGVAGTVKTGVAGLRLGSTATTGGTANPAFSTLEWISSLAMSLLALIVPVLAALIALIVTLVLLRFAFRVCRWFFKRPDVEAVSKP